MRMAFRVAVTATVAALSGIFIVGMPAQAADTQLGIDVGNIAYNQWNSANPDVQYRLVERSGEDCNFYTGFWDDPANDRNDGTSTSTCGPVSPGYMYRNGTKSWGDIQWRTRVGGWCADFAKFAFYWGGAKYTGLTPAAASFRTYGINNGTWHTSHSYVPRKGDAAVYDWDGNGTMDHVAIVTSYQTDSTDGNHYVVGGNQSDAVTHVLHNNWSGGIVGYASPAPK